MSTGVHSVLSAVSSVLEIPVIIILIIFMAAAVFSIGWIIVEHFNEHRHMTAYLPQLIDELKAAEGYYVPIVEESGLLKRQKELLLELTRHPELSFEVRNSLANNLLEKEQAHYERILKITDLIARLAPMFGLLGTLIPLGPGIIALGQGDTYTLSVSLKTAFDTTIAGLATAAVCVVISAIRRRWYDGYMSDLETLVDCVLELEDKNEKEQ